MSSFCAACKCILHENVSASCQCSGECGEGRMVRSVTCRSSGGLVMSDGQCDQPLRPHHILTLYKDRALFSFASVFQCNATCGRGVRQRQVVCAGLEGGVFKEFPDSSCNQTNKPQMSSSCFQRPCSKWFTTSWSQVATPVIRAGNEGSTRYKNSKRADFCQDKATANCALVLKVKLCSHWYYRKACCQSCKAPRP
uniref:ADAMTS-like protein 2 n=1 Tax=Pundamilia nyererei TaxID=303518 RepID=A0A3B4GTJ2_9CICH